MQSFGDGYVTLYNTNNFYDNNYYDYYTIYNENGFYYSSGSRRVYSQSVVDVQVTDNWLYRRDVDSIFIIIFSFVLFGLFLFNVMTSIIRKGGVLGGLL